MKRRSICVEADRAVFALVANSLHHHQQQGSMFFGVLVEKWGDAVVMIICAVIAAVSLVITLICVDSDVGKR